MATCENGMPYDDGMGQNARTSVQKPSWKRHGGYLFFVMVKEFFFGETKKDEGEESSRKMLEGALEIKPSAKSVQVIDAVVHIHRVIENTRARRRLEKWSSRIIATYLLVVLMVVFSAYTTIPWLHVLDIPNTIMTVILSTTTLNIIGIGLIVLRGHFEVKEKPKVEQEQDNEQ